MNKQFIQVTNGLLPVAVLALLIVALIAAQARANLPGQVADLSAAAFSISATDIFSADMLRNAPAGDGVADHPAPR